ncbi:MAG: FHA domain-containing protein [Anaerolineae bacterium]|nr:FHA domain-containing protein [Candidatus Roseilinea sp.]MDW8449316.1 FHA domain-containing protein [Anaerolineae bacterium]
MNQDAPMLIIESGQLAGQRWLIDSDVVVIGREIGIADLMLPERQVSRRHAKIERTPEGFVLTDLNSKNGTFLNGKEVKEPKLLQDGDEIQIALCVKIAFVGSDATAPLNARPISKAMRPVVRGIRIDKDSRRVYIAEQELEPPLSLQQYRLLELLVDANGGLVSRQDIVERVWEGENAYGVSEQAIDALVRRLRDRIAERDPDHEYIVTVRGHGLRFENRYQ